MPRDETNMSQVLQGNMCFDPALYKLKLTLKAEDSSGGLTKRFVDVLTSDLLLFGVS